MKYAFSKYKILLSITLTVITTIFIVSIVVSASTTIGTSITQTSGNPTHVGAITDDGTIYYMSVVGGTLTVSSTSCN
jgi:hypothetical protein